jgi:ABC-type dipeptide/oligopeptide/nickel transport system ATPase component
MTTTIKVDREQPRPLLDAVSFEGAGDRRTQAVDGLRLTIYPRQAVALVGESGCGKSVTALSIMRLLPCPPARYDRGEILYRGRDLCGLSPAEMLSVRGGEIAMIFQEPMASLNPVYSVGDQMVEAIRLHQSVGAREARALAVEALREVGLSRPERRIQAYPHEFSGGMCQRIMTAMAIACRPGLLLADEPTTALDVTIQAQILDLLGALRRERGMSMMLITHDLGVVAREADVVCVMYQGRVVEYATVFELFDHPMHPYTRGLFQSIPRLDRRIDRLRTVRELVADPRVFRTLPGYQYGVVPWWPHVEPPEPLEDESVASTLVEVEPGHWVACWRTAYVAQHPARRPDLTFRREPRRPRDGAEIS